MRTPFVIVFMGFCVGSVAIAAPVPSQSGPPVSKKADSDKPKVGKVDDQGGECATPTANQCVSDTYAASLCGKQKKSACKDIVEKKFETFHKASSAPGYKMLPPGQHNLPSDLQDGKYFKYAGPKQNIMKRADHQLGRTKIANLSVARMAKVSAADAAKAHRNPAWDANGRKVTSCEEYGYEEFYDIGRFIDAAAACRGDQDCVFDVAMLPQTPGLANRVLNNKSDKPFITINSQLQLWGFPTAKNDFFAMGPDFVRSHGDTPLKPTVQTAALEQALQQGQNYYSTGCTGNACDDRHFKNEWEWHKAMRQKTKHLSPAEFEEYAQRRARFRRLIAAYGAAVAAEQPELPEEVARVFPYDARTRDPFERLDIATKYVRDARVQEQKFRQTATPAELKRALGEVQVEQGQGVQVPAQKGQGMQGALAPTILPGGMLAAPAQAQPANQPKPKKATGLSKTAGLVAGAKAKKYADAADPYSDTAYTTDPGYNFSITCQGYDKWGMETFKRGPISCEIGEFLRAEWDRKVKGKKSCLDLGNTDCDWEMAMFTARFVEPVPNLSYQEYFERQCMAWTGGTLNNKNSLEEVRAYIAEMQETIGEAKMALADFEAPGGKGYDKTWKDKEVMGDKDWFGASYDYDVGFKVARVDNSQCEIAGGFHAKAGVDAYLVNNEIEVIDVAVTTDVNKGGDHKSTMAGHMRVLGKSITPSQSTSTVFSVTDGTKLDLPPGYRPSFTVPAGPVPITGSAWGEVVYGATLSASTKVPTCSATNPKFGVNASFEPFVMVNGRAQVGIGISGLVSAGVRGMLNLVYLSLPFTVGLSTGTKQIAGETQGVLDFDMGLSLTLATLSGRLSLYLEFLFYEEEWELFRWRGVGPAKLDLMPPVHVELPLVGLQ